MYRRVAAIAAAVVAVGFLTPPAPAAALPGGIECGQKRTDALHTRPWPLNRLEPELAWPMSRGRDVVVAVIDSGISGTHPSLSGQVLPGVNLVPATEKKCDNTHGTLVAAIIAGRDDPDVPFHGVAPDARILPVRVLPDAGQYNDPEMPKRIADGIRYAVKSGASVINLSLQTIPTDDLAQAVAYAIASNVVVVAAAGNVGSAGAGQPVYPAAYDGVIAVAGVDENGKHAASSVSGSYVTVAAPGVNIIGPAPQGNGYGVDEAGGTSFAAAYVSGVAALLRAYQPNATVGQIRRRIELTADAPPDGFDPQVGYGVVNPYRALGEILDPRSNARLATARPVPLPATPADALWSAKRAAAWVAPLGILLAGLLLLVRPVLRRGRARAWRTGG